MGLMIPKLGLHATGQWRVHSRRHGDIYFGARHGRAVAAYAAWVRETFGADPPPDKPPQTVAGAVALYARTRSTFVGHCLKPFATWAVRRRVIRLADVSQEGVAQYAEHLRGRAPKSGRGKLKPETIRHYVSALNQFFRWCRQLGYVAAEIKAPPVNVPKSAPKSLSPSKRDAILKALKKDNPNAYRLLVTAYMTGARPGELVNLRWSQVNVGARTITVTDHKTAHATGQARTLRLTDGAAKALGEPGADDEWVFVSRLGAPYTVSGLRCILRKFRVTTYQLRHTFAQDLLDSGAPLDVVAELLGHRSLKMVQRYTHVKDSRVRQYLTLEVPGGVRPSPSAKRRPARERQRGAGPRKRGRGAGALSD